MDNEYPAELIIIAGEQLGARASLNNNYTVTLSGESDTDLLLRDTSIDKERLKLTTRDNKAYIEVLAGHIEMEGKPLVLGKKTRLHEYAKVRIGDTVFVYTNNPSASWEQVQSKVTTDNKSLNQNNNQLNTSTKRNHIIMVMSAILIVFITAFSTVATTLKSNKRTSISSDDIQHMLLAHGYESLSIHQHEDGQLSIIGFVMTYKDRAKLEKLVDENNIPVTLDMEIGDQLAMEVRELFRINGVEVSVTAFQEGKVKVTGKQSNAEEIDRIKAIALSEIANLKSMNLEFSESDEDPKIIGSDMKYNDDDKRITMVVDGEPAYIMTSDQSKYYVGALLPTGYKIIDIIDKQVVLEKQGKQKTLEF